MEEIGKIRPPPSEHLQGGGNRGEGIFGQLAHKRTKPRQSECLGIAIMHRRRLPGRVEAVVLPRRRPGRLILVKGGGAPFGDLVDHKTAPVRPGPFAIQQIRDGANHPLLPRGRGVGQRFDQGRRGPFGISRIGEIGGLDPARTIRLKVNVRPLEWRRASNPLQELRGL